MKRIWTILCIGAAVLTAIFESGREKAEIQRAVDKALSERLQKDALQLEGNTNG